MIVERCKALEVRFSVARKRYELEERLDRVQHAVGRVETLRQQAEKASEILTTLSSRATDPEVRAGIEEAVGIAEAHRGLISLWKPLKADEHLLVRRNHEAYQKALHATENTSNNLRRAAERTWRDYTNSHLQDDRPILDVFKGTNARTVVDLTRLRRELLDVRKVAFPSRAEIERFDEKVIAYRDAFKSLGGNIPRDVRAALQAAASGGAPIDLFSPNVVAWLQKRGVAGSFRVIPLSAP